MRGESLKGHMDMLLLGVLADGPRHGYALIQELKNRSGGALDLPEGTVYPALHRLNEQKLVSSRWSVVDGRRRRTYSLTRRGSRELDEQQKEWREFSEVVRQVMGGEAWPATP